MKKLSIFLLALVACAGIAKAEIYNGSCGANLTWSLNTQDSTLTITGSGEMTNWSGDPYAPWYDYRSYIKYVSLPDGVTSIGDYAFFYCTGLTSVTIPSSVTNIGDWAFSECSGLTAIDVAADNPNYCAEDGVLFNKDKSILIQYPAAKQGSNYTIPNSVTSIGWGAFYGCSKLTSVEIPKSVTSIGGYAFVYCSGLTSVKIPNSVTSIGEAAFYYCSNLTSVTIPNSVTSIGNSAFSDCTGLTSVTIPNSVTSIEGYAFAYCSGLTSVTNYATTPQSINSDVFGGGEWAPGVVKSTCVLYVPKESVSLYQAAEVWKEFTNIVGVDTPQGVEKVLSDKVSSTKLIRNGNVYILTDDKTYTITGQAVK